MTKAPLQPESQVYNLLLCERGPLPISITTLKRFTIYSVKEAQFPQLHFVTGSKIYCSVKEAHFQPQSTLLVLSQKKAPLRPKIAQMHQMPEM